MSTSNSGDEGSAIDGKTKVRNRARTIGALFRKTLGRSSKRPKENGSTSEESQEVNNKCIQKTKSNCN